MSTKHASVRSHCWSGSASWRASHGLLARGPRLDAAAPFASMRICIEHLASSRASETRHNTRTVAVWLHVRSNKCTVLRCRFTRRVLEVIWRPTSNHRAAQESCATVPLLYMRRDGRFHALYNFEITSCRQCSQCSQYSQCLSPACPSAAGDRYHAPGSLVCTTAAERHDATPMPPPHGPSGSASILLSPRPSRALYKALATLLVVLVVLVTVKDWSWLCITDRGSGSTVVCHVPHNPTNTRPASSPSQIYLGPVWRRSQLMPSLCWQMVGR